MTTATAAPGLSGVGRTLTWLTVRGLRRGALIVAATATGITALVAAQFQATFAGTLDTDAMRALAENPAVRVLFGPARALDDPGGFTVWRTGTPVLVLCGVWALLAATRITRGEEDAGRYDLLMGTRARLVDPIVRGAAVLALAAALVAVGVGAALLLTGTDPAGALVHAAGVFATTTVFAALGLLAAQLLPSRGAATGTATAILGIFLMLRMLADGVPAFAWTAWLTPFGLTNRAAAYVDNRPAPLFVILAMAALLTAVALAAARHRDLGGAVLTLSGSRPARTRLLKSVPAFALRRAVAPTAGWAVGIAAYFLLIGAVLAAILDFLGENPRFADLAATAGFGGLNTPEGFAAAMFALLAIPTGLYAATRISTMAADEKNGRWTVLHSLAISRSRLAGAETVVTGAGIAVLLATAAIAMWLGALLTGAPLDLLDALAGAFNAAPVALLSLGAALLAMGWYPAAVGAVGAVPVAGGFLLDVLVQSVGAPGWLREISPFAHLAAVPDTPPDWAATAVITAIGLVLIGAGLYGYTRRDLHG
ncbi:polyketide antibiotic transporter [Nocardia carnea]|uniref:polyketide antibiotic transporter n=1 Tax=Nocardia carnea TaxID=37328 RepID=UPI0024549FAB|nr:polyketide antibiotic transporter [Nocardia carnea]